MCSWNLFSGLNFCLILGPHFHPHSHPSVLRAHERVLLTWTFTVPIVFSFRVFPSIYSNGNFVSIGQGFPNLILTLSHSLLIPPSTIHLDHIQLLYTIHHSSLTLSQFPSLGSDLDLIHLFIHIIHYTYLHFIYSFKKSTYHMPSTVVYCVLPRSPFSSFRNSVHLLIIPT